MTQEDQDALIGKTVRELRDVRERLAKLTVRAQAYADAFGSVGMELRHEAEYLRLSGEGTDTRFIKQRGRSSSSYAHDRSEYRLYTRADLDINVVIELRDEIRQCIVEQERLTKNLSDMGYKQT